MKTSNIFLTLFFISSIAFSQEQQLKKNEIKTNFVLHWVNKIPITYERVLHKKHSVGIDAFYDYDFFNPNYKTGFFGSETKYGFRIFYKRYIFSKKYAEGFFLKPMFGIVRTIDDDTTDSEGNPVTPINEIRKSAGFFLGYKFNFLKHFLIELQLELIAPMGHSFYRNYFSNHDIFGVSLGYQF